MMDHVRRLFVRVSALALFLTLASACSSDRSLTPAAKPVGETFAATRDEPLFIVDGKTVSSLAALKKDDILTVEVLKGPAAARLYGEAAQRGVVVVTTKTRK
jgi:TonB-dependent SusC/RagA subfamily outer membrane receptor